MIESRLDKDLSEGVETVWCLICPHLDEIFLVERETTMLFNCAFRESLKERAVFDGFLEIFRCEVFR